MRSSLLIAVILALFAAPRASAALTVTLLKSSGSNTPVVGETYRYNLVVNVPSGTLAAGAVISDPLPSGLQFIQASTGGSYSAGTVSWSLSSPLTCANVEVTLTPFADDSGLWGAFADVQSSDADWAISTLAYNGSSCDMASHSSWFYLSSLSGYSVASVSSVKIYYQWHEDDTYPVTTYFQNTGDLSTGIFGPRTLTAGVGQPSDVIESWDVTALGAPWTFDSLQHLDVMIEHACGGNTGTSPHHAYMNRVWAVVDFQSCGTSVWFDASPTNSLANNAVLNNTATVSGGGLGGPVSSNTVPVTVQAPTLSLTKTAQPLIAAPGDTIAYTLNYSAYANGLNLTDTFSNNYTANSMPGWSSKGGYTPGWNTSNGALSFAMGTTGSLPNTGYDLATRSDSPAFSDGVVSADLRIDPSVADSGNGVNTGAASIAYLIQPGGAKFYKTKVFPCASSSGFCIDVQDSNWNEVCGVGQIPAGDWNPYPAWNNIKVAISNYTFTLFVNGAQVFYCDDPTHFITTPGQAGFYSDGGLASWDNFHIGSDIMAKGVTVWDTLPACMSYVAGSASPAASVAGQLISWNLGSLSPGTSGSVSFKAAASACAAGTVTNTASAMAGNAQQVASSAGVQVIQPLVKSASAASLAAGANLTYALAYTATGGGGGYSDSFSGTSWSGSWMSEALAPANWAEAGGLLGNSAWAVDPFVALQSSGTDGRQQVTLDVSVNNRSGLVFGYQGGSYYWVAMKFSYSFTVGGDALELHYVSGGTDTVINQIAGLTLNPASAATETLGVTRVGNQFMVVVNGAGMGTLVDAANTLPGAGLQGVYGYRSGQTFASYSWLPGYKAGVVLRDTLPAGMSLVTVTAGVLLAGPPQVAQWVMPPAGLAPGSTWNAQLVVQPSGIPCGWVTNTAMALVGMGTYTSNLVGVTVTCGSPTFTPTLSSTASPSATASATASRTATSSGTPTPTATASPSGTATPSRTPTPSATPTASSSATSNLTFTFTGTPTRTASPSSSATPTASSSATLSFTLPPTGSATDSPTASFTPTTTMSSTATATSSPTRTASPSATPSPTPPSSATATATASPSPTGTMSGTATLSFTLLPTGSATGTPTASPSSTPSPSPTATASASPSSTDSPTLTQSPSASSTRTQTPSFSATPSFSCTRSSTATGSATPSSSPTRTATASATPSLTFTVSPTISMTATKSPVVFTAVPPLIMAPGPGVYPDPFSDKATIWFKLSADAQARLAVYNVAGEKVRTLQQACKRGMNKLTWAGDNNYGARCASGYYILRLLADSTQGGQHDSRWLQAVITR